MLIIYKIKDYHRRKISMKDPKIYRTWLSTKEESFFPVSKSPSFTIIGRKHHLITTKGNSPMMDYFPQKVKI